MDLSLRYNGGEKSTDSEGTRRMKAQILEPHPLASSRRQSQALVMVQQQRGLCIAQARRFIFDLDKPPSKDGLRYVKPIGTTSHT